MSSFLTDKHVIIVGSGLGGLVCGYILAKNGFRVTVLEKNGQAGGCLQTFSRGGVKFETGMHYIGSMDRGQTLYKFFNYLSLLPDIQLSRLNTDCYDIISIGGQKFPFANGKENFVQTLAEFFPQEKENLQKYFDVVSDVAQKSPLYSLNFSNSPVFLNAGYIQQSANGFIESATDNSLLQSVLSGNVPLYAGVYGKTPLYIHALITHFYNNSAFRIVGGSDIIVRSLANSIKKMGGEVLTNKEVTKINCNSANAVSVSLKSGDTFSADFFISNTHPVRMLELLDTNLIRKAYRHRIQELSNTTGIFTVYIRFKKGTMPYLNSNFYFYKNENTAWNSVNYDPKAYPDSFLYMHQCTQSDQIFAEGAVLMAYMNFEEVERWKGTKTGSRGADYKDFKRCRAEEALLLLEKQLPGTINCIAEYYTSTPLTYFDYTGTERGSMYGVLRDCNYPVQTLVSQRTKIPNLFQTGQNINSHGILGVIIGAVITSGELLGINSVIEQVRACG
ncbi:MAG: NAD(P)/FAD-dependent oxidoreductase [Prevotellaceae bacterium]|jgi:all-trans-retinol 13,14-reductase|nr:NAD(P)/FAD-dependent oxidoreductase [Prevotellaceae bacterium]